jgi:hypothetical protein
MSRKLKELLRNGHSVDADVLKMLSPYRREHINRLRDYLLDRQRSVRKRLARAVQVFLDDRV